MRLSRVALVAVAFLPHRTIAEWGVGLGVAGALIGSVVGAESWSRQEIPRNKATMSLQPEFKAGGAAMGIAFKFR